MNQKITVKKFEGKHVKGIIEFPIQKGRKTAYIQIVKSQVQTPYTSGYFYVSHMIKGAEGVLPLWLDVQRKYRALEQVQESEILEQLA